MASGTANEKVADITAFRDEIRAFRVDLKSDMDDMREDMRKELNEFRKEMDQKMKEFSGDLQATTVRVTEMEQRIADTEECNGAAGDALLDVLEKQREMQAKIIDLELAPDGTTCAYMESKRDRRGVIWWSLWQAL